jgi:hypothetical protein
MRRRRGARALAAGALVGALAAPVGWHVTDRLEQHDDFCNACHLASGEPLHASVRRDFMAAPPASLAAAHAAAGNRARADGAFRCIDCHGGTGAAGRLRVKALAARDAVVWALLRFEEPQGMRWPLRDADCARCHARFGAAREPWEPPRFHQVPLHNVDLGVACVECHAAHETGGDAGAAFLRAAPLRAQCARCHAEFEEGRG